jgi:hypothetical protein
VKTVSAQNPLRFAALNKTTGVVIDYVTIDGSIYGNMVFKGDTTYFVSGQNYIEGTTTIEGGTVIKYNDLNSGPVSIQIDNNFVCTTSPYQPAVFTAQQDTSVGENLGAGTINSGNYGSPMLLLNFFSGPTLNLNNLQFRYAQTAVTLNNVDNNYCGFNDSQFINCIQGIFVGVASGTDESGGAGISLQMNNCLMAGVQHPCNLGDLVNYLNCVNCTFANANEFVTTAGNPTYLTCANSIFANVSSPASPFDSYVATNNGFYNSSSFGSAAVVSSTYPFRTAGNGNYYLTNGSVFWNAGTTNIDPTLRAKLATKTTFPPIVYSGLTVYTNTTLNPQAQRDTDAPDLGYHYDPLDYILDSFKITNALLTLGGGTAIACYNEAGIILQTGSSLVAIGTPLQPNWFVRSQSVQEQQDTIGTMSTGQTVSSTGSGSLVFQFSKFACPAYCGYHLYDAGTLTNSSLLVQNCEFYGGQNVLTGSTNTVATLVNNLFWRSPITAAITNLSSTALALTNNLVYGSAVTLKQPTNAVWYAFNNDFDSCTLTNCTLTNGYNAFLGTSGRLSPTNSHDVVSSTALTYQSGYLGLFYQATNSILIHKGSPTADLIGLYHFTVTTNQVVEGTNSVSIGYHYVATDSNGNPLDTDGDGVPDYLEDANGNGVVDAGENSWTNYNSFNGLVTPNGLKVYTPLK